jgi:hypothetical protein
MYKMAILRNIANFSLFVIITTAIVNVIFLNAFRDIYVSYITEKGPTSVDPVAILSYLTAFSALYLIVYVIMYTGAHVMRV